MRLLTFNEAVREGLYPEHSITRRINRENVLLLGGGRALLMQLAHPSVAAGVDEHSDFRADPLRRLRRTVRLTMAIIFGDRETALAAVRTVNRVHSRVRGQGYHALDPDLLLWVHATLVDSALVTYAIFVKPVTPREREDFYQESKLAGEMLGIPRGHFPDRVDDFDRYMTRMLDGGGVAVSDRSRALGRVPWFPRLRRSQRALGGGGGRRDGVEGFSASHRCGGRGRPAHEPAMMGALLLGAYARVGSARRG